MADELPFAGDDVPAVPPADAEEWTDEQWLAWLQATDAAGDPEPGPRTVSRWRDRAVPSVLGAAMLGLRDAIYGRPDDEVVIVADAPGEPPDDDKPVVELDPEHHEAIVRRRPRRA